MYRAGVITASDSGSRGERIDESGKILEDKLSELSQVDIQVSNYEVLPDDREKLSVLMRQWAQEGVDLILTTGGTGLAPRDFTPEATKDVIDREVPGMQEAIRRESISKTPHGMLSRGIAGVKDATLIINFPGSPKAVTECFDVIVPALPHALETLSGQANECAKHEH